ncbi:uncharacterized protein LOC6582926 [Drosophila mojavensis]|uniref:MD-2-related lipid-recognition domain-containing protein n=1 Tax=Drosophila mojavensis TaxID=7230 RepID=B4L049_DROMO|nr:uncharacterized protein LOC6582926 [Drosophila mojavensis]EDW19084.1 uncharacterized protein Dmoj_GI13589 [Drosophila mojavensis]
MKWAIVLIVAQVVHHIAGEQAYVVSNEQLEPFEGDSETLVIFDNLKTIGRERAINGSFSFLGDMNNDDFKVSVELYSSPNNDGDFKRMVFDVPQTSICECFKKFYVQFVQPSVSDGETTNFPLVGEDTCPIPQGEYYIKSVLFNTQDWPEQVPRGMVKAIITFFTGGKNVGGFIMVVKIEDRQN